MTHAKTGTHLLKLKLTNYRLFESCEIDFHPELTVVVGRNGGGKTAVLDALALALRPFVDLMDGRSQARGIPRADIRRAVGPDGHPQLVLPTGIAVDARVLEHSSTAFRLLESEKGNTKGDSRDLTTLAKRLTKQLVDFAERRQPARPELPVFAYYGTGRLWNVGRMTALKMGRKDPTPNSPTRGYTDALSSSSHYLLFADWFMKLSREIGPWTGENPLGTPALERIRGAVRRAVDVVLRPTGWSTLSPDWIEETLYMARADGPRLPVSSLSDGIRTMIGLAGDLAHRCARLNPDFAAQAAERSQGIVLIDEVDMHLHPEWQQVVLPSLREAFPNVQFIVTTHSPQVLSTVPRECIRILDGDRVTTPSRQTDGVESAQVMLDVMGVDPVPDTPEVTELRELEIIVADGEADAPRAKALYEKLVSHYGEQHPVILDLEKYMRWERFKKTRDTGAG